MPISARPLIQLGYGIGIVGVACWAVAAGMGCFSSRAPLPIEQPIVEEMPPAEPTMTALPEPCAGLPALASMLSANETGTDDQEDPAGRHIPVWVQASSFISTARGAGSLFDRDPKTYWHIDLARRLPVEWVVFDFGAGSNAAIDGLSVKPRLDEPTQLFTAACLLGSSDGKNWNGIGRLNAAVALTPRWMSWRFTGPQRFRYFQIAIPNEGRKFYSVGKLRFLSGGGPR